LNVKVDQGKLASAALTQDGAEPIRGYVDACERAKGISGWAVDISDPGRILTIELLVDETVVAECQADILRADIAQVIKADALAGFRFPDATVQILSKLAARSAASRITLRIGGTDLALPSPASSPLLGEAFGDHSDVTQSPLGLDLEMRLANLRSQAVDFASQPLRRSADALAGFIEVLSVQEAGWVWLAGWMRRPDSFDSPVVVMERQKVPGGFAYALYERPDVDEDACGFIGVVNSDWRPDPLIDPYLVFGEDLRAQMNGATPARLIPFGDFLEYFDTTREGFYAGHAEALRVLIMRRESWNPAADNAVVTSQSAIETVLILPGFGCLVSGWVVSLLKPIDSLILKLGSSKLSCDRDSLFFSARPDLAAIFPGYDKLADRAGFTGVFRGYVTLDNLDSPILKLQFADGTSHNHAVNVRALRHLGRAVSIEAALKLYPSIISEFFFPDFAEAVRRQARAGFGSSMAHIVKPASRVVVVTAPEDRSSLFLMFEELRHRTRSFPSSLGFAIVAGTGQLRADIVGLFSALQEVSKAPCSLFFVDDSVDAFYALPEFLAALGARSFVFIGPDIHLTESGWQAAAQYLNRVTSDLQFLEVGDPAAPGQAGSVTAACFAWTSIALSKWLTTAPYHVGGFLDEKPLPPASDRAAISRGGAWFSKLPVVTPLSRAINRLVENA
jgi:hypothetical protein